MAMQKTRLPGSTIRKPISILHASLSALEGPHGRIPASIVVLDAVIATFVRGVLACRHEFFSTRDTMSWQPQLQTRRYGDVNVGTEQERR